MYLTALLSIALLSGPSALAPQAAPATKPAVKPAAQGAKPAGGARTVEIAGADDMKFSVTTIDAKPGETLRIRLTNKGTLPKIAMAHNFVLLKLGAKQIDFANAAALARATDFIPPDMKDQVLVATTLAGPGETVEATIMAENHFNLPSDQAAAMAAHWAKFSQADIEAVQNEWPVLIGKVKEAMAAGTDPRTPEVRALAERAAELTRMFSGGNASVEGQLKQRYETDPELQKKTGIDPALMAYLAKARGE